MVEAKKIKEPLFHITKRAPMPIWKTILIRASAVLIAILLSSVIIILITGQNPFSIFASMFHGAFGDAATQTKAGVADTRRRLLQEMAILLSIALAITPAFKMKFWNIGAQGQVLMGALLSAIIARDLGVSLETTDLGSAVNLILMLLAGAFGGALWAVIPAIFKAKWNTNETLFTLMMNYIVICLIGVVRKIWEPNNDSIIIANGHFPDLFGQKYVGILLFAIALTAFMFFYLKKSKHGYEISLVGESVNSAKYAGISVAKITIRTLIFSGAICGIVGAMLVGSIDHNISTTLDRGYGFTAILVSWLAKFNPLFMILTSFLVVFFLKGGAQLADDFGKYGVTNSFGDIIIGIIFFFIIGCEFFIAYSIKFHKKKKAGN